MLTIQVCAKALFGRAAGRQLRGRILALELLLAVLTNPGPVFRNNDVFISLVKKDLCLPLSKSGISPNRKRIDSALYAPAAHATVEPRSPAANTVGRSLAWHGSWTVAPQISVPL